MNIHFSPIRTDNTVEFFKDGEAITINGKQYIFSNVIEGEPLETFDMEEPWLVGKVERIGGELNVTLVIPHGPYPSQAVAFPEPLMDAADGVVRFPFDEPAPPEPEAPTAPGSDVPLAVSDRQFVQQLADMELITKDEALAYVRTGTLPQALNDLVAQLPEDRQFDAMMKLTGANSFERYNPLTEVFAAMYQMSSAKVDDLWRAASKL